ncbi:hypothetical protein ACHAXT_011815 [Thalassiosira profunda]
MAKAAILIAATAASGLIHAAGAFTAAPAPTTSCRRCNHLLPLRASSSTATNNILDGITLSDKLELRDPIPDERGKGGVSVSGDVAALEVLARIPRHLVVSTSDMPPRAHEAVSHARNNTWATDLTAATLAALHPTEDELSAPGAQAKQAWIASWLAGGWGSATDLGADIFADVVGTLLATGSDNDENIYAKFRMPCHPATFKASMGLEFLTKCSAEEARRSLAARGFAYRSMRDALQELVLESTERPEKKGTKRDKRCWDVADVLDRVLARATQLGEEGGGDVAIVPIYERLAHSLEANAKLVSMEEEVLLVATRDIAGGEAVTRDYVTAPMLENETAAEGSALRLLLQFGLPPSAWPKSEE